MAVHGTRQHRSSDPTLVFSGHGGHDDEAWLAIDIGAHLDRAVTLVQRAEEAGLRIGVSAGRQGPDAITPLAFLAAKTIPHRVGQHHSVAAANAATAAMSAASMTRWRRRPLSQAWVSRDASVEGGSASRGQA